jgi:DNA-binding NarL/FixJ family response regulator
MKVAIGGGYPLLKSAIAKRLQADGVELTTSMRDANVVILTRGCMADVMRSMGRICDIGADACEREFECMLDVVKELSKHTAVLVLSDGNLGRVHRALQAGARGYVSERDDYSLNIGGIVRDVAKGRIVVGPRVASRLLQYQEQFQDQFTRREIDLLWLFADGYQVEEIADRLGVAKGTVYNTLNGVYGKLGVRGAIPAVLEAVRRGIITL